MKRLLLWIAALSAVLLLHSEALASHFRYGKIDWTVPDPKGAPTAVVLTVTYGILSPSPPNLHQMTLDFGDATNTGPMTGAVVGTGKDASGQSYEVRQFKASHTYASAGPFTAFFDACCRIGNLVNGGNQSYHVSSVVSLEQGNLGSPISASPPLIQLQLGAPRTYKWPLFDPDGDMITCRFGTEAETGFPSPVPVVPDPPGPGTGGESPALATFPDGCQLGWDLTDAQVGQRYALHVMFESNHGGVVSSTALDLIAEIVTPPPPTCEGGGVFVGTVGSPLSIMMTGTNAGAGDLGVSTIDAPSTASLAPGGTGPSPFTNTFSWTPVLAESATTRVVVVNFTTAQNLTGSCFLTLQVPECPDDGQPCTSGLGVCQQAGTGSCNGPGVTVCDATPGMPSPETCDSLDNDCDGVVDNGNPGGGMACSSGLPGICEAAIMTCVGGAVVCVAGVMPGAQAEICDDGLDQDCDGVVDNGCGGTGGTGGTGGMTGSGGTGGTGGSGGTGGMTGSGGTGGSTSTGSTTGTGGSTSTGSTTGSGTTCTTGDQCLQNPDSESVVAQGHGLFCAAASTETGGKASWLVALALGGLLSARRRNRRIATLALSLGVR